MDLPETMDATTTKMMTAPDFNDFATSIDNNNYDQHYLNEYLYYTFKVCIFCNILASDSANVD